MWCNKVWYRTSIIRKSKKVLVCLCYSFLKVEATAIVVEVCPRPTPARPSNIATEEDVSKYYVCILLLFFKVSKWLFCLVFRSRHPPTRFTSWQRCPLTRLLPQRTRLVGFYVKCSHICCVQGEKTEEYDMRHSLVSLCVKYCFPSFLIGSGAGTFPADRVARDVCWPACWCAWQPGQCVFILQLYFNCCKLHVLWNVIFLVLYGLMFIYRSVMF